MVIGVINRTGACVLTITGMLGLMVFLALALFPGNLRITIGS